MTGDDPPYSIRRTAPIKSSVVVAIFSLASDAFQVDVFSFSKTLRISTSFFLPFGTGPPLKFPQQQGLVSTTGSQP